MNTPTKRVLIADDHEPVRRQLKTFFESLGCAVDEGRNFHTVRELLAHNDYDLIVCDNGMPIGDEERPHHRCGIELMADAHLSERHTATPFVLHTGDDTAETKRLVKEMRGYYRAKDDTSPLHEFFEPLLKLKEAAP